MQITCHRNSGLLFAERRSMGNFLPYRLTEMQYTWSILNVYFYVNRYYWSIQCFIPTYKTEDISINEVHDANLLHIYFQQGSILEVYYMFITLWGEKIFNSKYTWSILIHLLVVLQMFLKKSILEVYIALWIQNV